MPIQPRSGASPTSPEVSLVSSAVRAEPLPATNMTVGVGGANALRPLAAQIVPV